MADARREKNGFDITWLRVIKEQKFFIDTKQHIITRSPTLYEILKNPLKKMMPETCYYDIIKEELVGSKKIKVTQYLRDDLIKPLKQLFKYIVLPTPGRKQAHTINEKEETCTCQAYQVLGQRCSHIMAVRIYVDQGRESWQNPMKP